MLVMSLWLSGAPLHAQTEQTVWLPLIVTAPATNDSNPLHTGIATFYGAIGAGACLFDPSPADRWWRR